MIPANNFHSLWADMCIYKNWEILSDLVLKQLAEMSKTWVCLCVCEEKEYEDEASNSPKTSLKCMKCIFRVGGKASYLQHLQRALWESVVFGHGAPQWMWCLRGSHWLNSPEGCSGPDGWREAGTGRAVANTRHFSCSAMSLGQDVQGREQFLSHFKMNMSELPR